MGDHPNETTDDCNKTEFDRFEELTNKLLKVSKEELDRELERQAKEKAEKTVNP